MMPPTEAERQQLRAMLNAKTPPKFNAKVQAETFAIFCRNLWPDAEVDPAFFDDESGSWCVIIERGDGSLSCHSFT